ncbi:MAG TPA: HAD hydrolase-like protein [Brevefilum sp.]|nr:HAD hydrolase-like protein [Brevefilum sp.]
MENITKLLNQNSIEIITPGIPQGTIKFALFDFDGTISLIREGWQQIMIPMMVEILLSTPRHENLEEIEQVVRAYVAKTTGKQTIYQMIRLAEEVELRGGTPEDPLAYKQRYHDLLMDRIIHRLDGLREGKIQPDDLMVPGTLNALKQVTQNGVVCFLASGTDEKYVFDEANLLGVDHFFQGIYGAQDNYESFSKRMVIQKIIHENHLNGPELIAFGDGYVEIEDTKTAGGIAIGLATDEANRSGVDEWKRDRLIASGADVIMPDFKPFSQLWDYLMPLD